MKAYKLENTYKVVKNIEYYKYVYTEKSFNFAQNGSYISNGCQYGNVVSANEIYGGANAYEVGQNHPFTVGYSYSGTLLATTYKFTISISGQGNGYINNPTVTLKYDDGTSEVVYTKNWSGSSLTENFTFVASKPIKSIEGTGTMTHSSVSFVGVQMNLTSNTFIDIESQESTSSDYDYYVDENTYKAFNI